MIKYIQYEFFFYIFFLLFFFQEERHQKELTQLKCRLDKLDNVQKEHFEELQNIMSSTPHEISIRTEEKADSEKS